MIVLKRDGKKEEWNDSKLVNAITKAATEAGEVIEDFSSILQKIKTKVENKNDVVEIATLHKAVEDVLMGSKYKNIARAYISKRSERDKERESKSKLICQIDEFINQTSDEFTKENANKAAGIVSTHRDLLAGIVSKHIATTQLLDKEVAKAHNDGAIHVHDLDYYLSPLTNCLLVGYEDMLANGFKLGDAEIETPKSIGTAATILTQISQAVASATYGGQTHALIDSGLKPYVEASYNKLKEEQKKWGLPEEWVEEKIEKEVYDAMQSILYQIQTLTTTNGQTPFQTLTFGLDTSKFGRMITRNYLKVHMAGVGKNKATPVFPKVVFMLEEGVNMNPEDPNYDLKKLAIECSTKRIYPDYVSVPKNKEITGVTTDPVSPMSCRSYLSVWKDENGKEKLNQRFNLGVVSLNLPYIALDSIEKGVDFFEHLSTHMELAYKAHMDRVERLKGTKAKQNPTMWMNGAVARLKPEDTIDHLFYGGYASISIGYIGAWECATVLEDLYYDQKTEKEIATEVLSFIKEKCEEFKKRSNIGFSSYGTPSEAYCLKAANAIKQRFGDVFGRDYITNSFHLPVWLDGHPVDKFGYEQGFAEISTGGNISYIEIPNLSKNPEAYEGLVDYAYHSGMHYFAFNTPVDQCYKCGHNGEFIATLEGYHCPECGNSNQLEMSVLRRVSGYISSPSLRPYNKGKQQECTERVKHFKEVR